MRMTVDFGMDNDAFVNAPEIECGCILRAVAQWIEAGETSGSCHDHNGNAIGKWAIIEGETAARLIAAAPDLLTVAQEIVSWAEQRKRGGDDCPCPLTVKHARAAIAKANRPRHRLTRPQGHRAGGTRYNARQG